MKITARRASGFTLIEALITLAITAILASIAVPSFNKMIQDNRVSTASNDFLSALMFARSEAAKRSIPVSICASDNGIYCSSGQTNYANGWMIFADCSGDGQLTRTTTICDLDGDGANDPDQVLKVELGLKSVAITSSTHPRVFTYQFSGRSARASFSIGPKDLDATKEINVAITGRARLDTM